MRVKLTVVVGVAMLLLAAGGCSPAVGASTADDAELEMTIDEFMQAQHIAREIEVARDRTLKVALGANPSTGYSWTESATIENPAVLQQRESSLVLPEGQAMLGAGGGQVWTFSAVGTGSTTVYLEYGQPWDGGEKAVWTLALTVTVR